MERAAPQASGTKTVRIANKGSPLFGQSVLVLILALLVCNAARGLAGRLARGLALATAAGLNGVLDILGLDGSDSLHFQILLNIDGAGPLWMVLVYHHSVINTSPLIAQRSSPGFVYFYATIVA